MALHRSIIKFAVVLSLTFLAPLSLPTLTSSQAKAENMKIANLAGSWRGRGTVKTSLNGKKENIRCRLTNRDNSKAAKITILGNCSVGTFLLPVNGWIKRQGKGNTYKASLFNSLARMSSNFFTGKIKGKKLGLSYKGIDNKTKERVHASITIIHKTASSFDLQIKRADPTSKKQFHVGTIKFKKK
ncbi:MAG: hypothetical protein JKY83_13850 [Rhizobiaceae bacterium]|nr:hypothetical protein [Rhizobiaceae bacterium]